MSEWLIHHGDVLAVLPTLPEASVHCCITSPPYWGLRDYGVDGQLGLEPTPDAYVARMVQVFREVRRVLRDDGTLWMNMGDSYAGGGRGGNPTAASSTLQGSLASQEAARVKRRMTSSRRRDDAEIPRSDVAVPGLKTKDLVGMPWRLAFALQADGWYLRQDIIWHKPNPMPESVRDRCTKAHEYIFLLSKSERYYYDFEAMQEPVSGTAHARGSGVNAKIAVPAGWDTSKGEGGHGSIHRSGARPRQNVSFSSAVKDLVERRNRRSVWTVATAPFADAHFATFPPKLIEPCVLAGCPAGGTVLDSFTGSGTTGAVALEHGRNFVGIELNADYIKLARKRIKAVQPRLIVNGPEIKA